MNHDITDNRAKLDIRVRSYVYDQALTLGRPPTRRAICEALGYEQDVLLASLQRLGNAHILVLRPDTGEIVMASPFSGVPTPFLVEWGRVKGFANCIWDALGIPAMLHSDATISTDCGCCGMPMQLVVARNQLQPAEGIVHFAFPAVRWWDNIILT
jgi:hypothetical protein